MKTLRYTIAALLLNLVLVPTFGLAKNAQPAVELKPTQEETSNAVDDEPTVEQFWKAARNGDLETVKAAIESGIEVDAKTNYGATALFYACDRNQKEVVKYLLAQGASPNSKDTFYNASPVIWARMKGHKEVVLSLLNKGGEGLGDVFYQSVLEGDIEYVKQILESRMPRESDLVKARDAIKDVKDEDKKKELSDLFETLYLPKAKAFQVSQEALSTYIGKYSSDGISVQVSTKGDGLEMRFDDGEPFSLTAKSETEFSLGSNKIVFVVEGDQATQIKANMGGNELTLARSDRSETPTMVAENSKTDAGLEKGETKFGPTREATRLADLRIASANWPGFRGNGSRGIADGQNPPTKWRVVSSDLVAEGETTEAQEGDGGKKETEANGGGDENVLWKVPVPGLGLSCPTIWGDRIYLTSAVSEGKKEELKIGLYGDVDSVEEETEYEFRVLCFDKATGKTIWERTANKGIPAVKRHAKSSHANPTVATNGNHVIAFFGSEGLYCYSKDGDQVWKKDLGFLDSGWFYDPGYQWGFASSPVIHENKVVVQCDIQGQSFVAAFEIATGERLWQTERDEIPGWSTPLVHKFDDLAMLITNGTKSARGYNLENGELLWSLKENSEIVVPTPNVAHGMIFISSGYAPIRPIYAIKPDARGDISLPENTRTNAGVQWSLERGGPYMPSPIIYGDYLYCCANAGILTCYFAETGEVVYKKRMRAEGGGLSFTASPVAADGHLYFTAEDGRVLVVKAGPKFELAEVNRIGESTLATPAISEGAMYFRTQNSLIAVGEAPSKK